jgi:hypothetical protein
MKFIDPWASFQYMGGAFSIHISLALYGYLEIKQWEKTPYYKDNCLMECQSVSITDVKFMVFAHLFCIGAIL